MLMAWQSRLGEVDGRGVSRRQEPSGGAQPWRDGINAAGREARGSISKPLRHGAARIVTRVWRRRYHQHHGEDVDTATRFTTPRG
jgi:hypothetical protein